MAIEIEEKVFAEKQWQQAKTGKITCECGCSIPLRFAYRCFYCELYFCSNCVEKHFKRTTKDEVVK